jgi:hypothetical protein
MKLEEAPDGECILVDASIQVYHFFRVSSQG